MEEELKTEAKKRAFMPSYDLRTQAWIMQNGPPERHLPSEGSDDSERQAADLNVDDWKEDAAEWKPEGEEGDNWKPPPAYVPPSPPKASPPKGKGGRRTPPPTTSVLRGPSDGAADGGAGAAAGEGGEGAAGAEDGVADGADAGTAATPPRDDGRPKPIVMPPPQKNVVQVQFLTAEILAWHTEQQSAKYKEPMKAWNDRGAARWASNIVKPTDGARGTGNVDPRSKMHGLHGEEQGPVDDAERAAVGRRNCTWAPQASGRPSRAGALYASARRAMSIRRNLSNRDHHDSIRRRPATVRVSTPLPKDVKRPDIDRSKMSKEELARETEKLAREAARRAARRAAARAAALKAAKEAEEAELLENERVAAEQMEADAQRVAQVARRAAVAREAAQAARRRRQPIFNVPQDKATATRGAKKEAAGVPGSERGSTSPSQRGKPNDAPATQRSQRSVGPPPSEKGSIRSTPGASSPAAIKRRKALSQQDRQHSHSHRTASSPPPDAARVPRRLNSERPHSSHTSHTSHGGRSRQEGGGAPSTQHLQATGEGKPAKLHDASRSSGTRDGATSAATNSTDSSSSGTMQAGTSGNGILMDAPPRVGARWHGGGNKVVVQPRLTIAM